MLDAAQGELAAKDDEITEFQKREGNFRKLFEESNDAVYVYDFDGRIINANNKACDLAGYPRDVLLGMPFFSLQPETELSATKTAFKTGMETCAVRYESKFRRANGQIIDVEVSTSVVDLKEGVTQSIVSNISARKNMQRALEESEAKFRTFMETASDLMCVTDRDGKLVYANEAMLRALGYLREESANLTMKDILSQESLAVYREAQNVLRTAGEAFYEAAWETKNRKKIFGEMKEVGIFDEKGVFTGSRGVFRDLTERKKIEESQRLANLGKLAADVAHEVNNPITIILARAEMLQMERPDDKALQEKLKIILDQCDSAIDIVKRLLMFSKPSKGSFIKGDINLLVGEVVKLIEHQFMGDGIAIKTKFSPGLPEIFMDAKQIQEVFMNLLRNADEAMPKGGEVEIKTYDIDGKVYIEFKDTGEGISGEDMKKIFDPFFTTKEKGTGLGLSVCYGIMKAHNGDLKYVSNPGQGTSAIVTLPAA